MRTKFYEMRKKKGMTPEVAAETVKNTLYFGVMMVNDGEADGMVAGSVQFFRKCNRLLCDSENKTGYKAGIRVFRDRCTGL